MGLNENTQKKKKHKHMIKVTETVTQCVSLWEKERLERGKEALFHIVAARASCGSGRVLFEPQCELGEWLIGWLFCSSWSVGAERRERRNMGWIPCSGTSGTKKKIKKKIDKIQVQDKVVDQIKPSQGTDIVFFFFFFLKWGFDCDTQFGTIMLSPNESVLWLHSMASLALYGISVKNQNWMSFVCLVYQIGVLDVWTFLIKIAGIRCG